VRLGDRGIAFEEDARFFIDWIDRLIARTEHQGRFATADRKRAVVELFRRARQVYETIAATAARGGS
jgi:hypothetical protein